MTRRAAGPPDAGNAVVEFALWLPFVLLALCSCLQLMGLLYDHRAAEAAAQVAIRAQRDGGDPVAAARAALPSGGQEAVVTARHGSIEVRMPVRHFFPWLPAVLASASGSATDPNVTTDPEVTP